MNLNKLKGKLVENGATYRECANELNISVTSFSCKINGQRKFYLDECNALGNFLGMSPEEKSEIFLCSNLHDVQENCTTT